MKKQLHLLIGFLVVVAFSVTQQANAQAPQKMSYKSVLRNSSNVLFSNTALVMKISVPQCTASGTAVNIISQIRTTMPMVR